MELAYAEAYASNGGDMLAAARAAGYSSPQSSAYQVHPRPHVQLAIKFFQEAFIQKLDMKSLSTFDRVMDSTTNLNAAQAAARAVRELISQRDARKPAKDREAHEMTAAELRQAIADAERELSDRAVPVGPTIDVQATDIFA